MAETKRNELKAAIDPRLLAEVERYAEQAGTEMEYAVADLLRAGLAKLKPQSGGAKQGKRKAAAV